MFGKLLPLTKAENHCLDLVILEDRAAQDAVRWRIGFFGQIEDVRVGGHGDFPFPLLCILQRCNIGSDNGGQVPSDLVHRPVPPFDRQQFVDDFIGEPLLDDLGRIAADD